MHSGYGNTVRRHCMVIGKMLQHATPGRFARACVLFYSISPGSATTHGEVQQQPSSKVRLNAYSGAQPALELDCCCVSPCIALPGAKGYRN